MKRKEPLKLMPLDDLKKVLAEIVSPILPEKKGKKAPRTAMKSK